ncbi:RNA-directed RNA polymerase [Ranunculus cassubicifolius]
MEEHITSTNMRNCASLGKLSMSNSPLAYLEELEFRKAFLMLSYCGKKKLEDFVTVDKISRMKYLSMKDFEADAWTAIGRNCIKVEDRCKNVDWDSGRTYLYRCYVEPDATYTFKGPYLHKQRTHLQRVLGDESVLDVRFAEQPSERSFSSKSNVCYPLYHNIAKEGILVGLKRYRFFVFKDGGKAEKKRNPTSSPVKCYFVCTEADPLADLKVPCTSSILSVHQARCLFMHVHMVPNMAKYMARLSLILSKTIKLEIDLSSVKIQRIADIPCRGPNGEVIYSKDGEALIHTDGTGFISEDLASLCPANVYKVEYTTRGENKRVLGPITLDAESLIPIPSQTHIRDPPLLIQSRLFYNGIAVKGTFLINKKLPQKTIQIRPSMIKVETDPNLTDIQSVNSFEIVSTSYQPRKTSYLSRYLIALLSYGGVPSEFFMELIENSLIDARSAYTNRRTALKVSLNHGEMDDFVLSRMILSGIPLDEPYLKSRLSVVMKEEKKGLKNGKVPIGETYYLMGTSDPTGILKDDEVCVILDHGQVSGEVLVYRHPGLHFGDIHVSTAICVKELEAIVGNSKYAIFFPTNGPRSKANEIANGDFDGDMYWVSRNPQLLESYNASESWTRKYHTKSGHQRSPIDYDYKELEDTLFQHFLTTRFQPSTNIGSAADSWLSFMDRLLILGDDCAPEKRLLRDKMLRLIDLYYDALDAPKTGKNVYLPQELKAEKFPHYMERQNSFCSKSVLGLIYDKVNSFQTTAPLPSEDIWKIPCFRGDVPSICIQKWTEFYERYRKEMTTVLKIDDKTAKDTAANDIILKYKQILYGAPEFDESARKREDIFNEALAIYDVAYNYASGTENRKAEVGRCSFAWKVAGRALCFLYATKQEKDTIVCQISVLREILNL